MNFLIDPLTQEKISIYSKKAIGVLKKYVKQYIKNIVGGMDLEEEEKKILESLPSVPNDIPIVNQEKKILESLPSVPTDIPIVNKETKTIEPEEKNNIVMLSYLLDDNQDNEEQSKKIVRLYLLELDIMYKGIADVTFDKTYDAFYNKLKSYRVKKEEEDKYNYDNMIDFIENSYNFPDDIEKFKNDVLNFKIISANA